MNIQANNKIVIMLIFPTALYGDKEHLKRQKKNHGSDVVSCSYESTPTGAAP